MPADYISLREVLADALTDAEFRAEWERTRSARAVARWLVGYRLRHHLTQRQLGQLLGCERSVVSHLEAGDRLTV